MSKIHLFFEYTKERNKLFVVFVKNMTDFVYSTKEFLNISLKYKDLFYADESINPEKFCDDLKQDLLTEFKEKNLDVTYLIYVAMKDLVYYAHRWPHSKNNSFICEKLLLIEVDDASKISYDTRIDLSAELIPAKFRFKRDDKQADSVLMSNEPSIFYTNEFLESKAGTELILLQNRAISVCETKLKVKLFNILVLYDDEQ